MNQLLLAGDVGGTKTRLALIEKTAAGSLNRVQIKQYKSADFPNLQSIISQFLAESGTERVERGCIGVPGPVTAGEVKITNLPWHLSEREIEQSTGLNRLLLVNDLVATAAAIPYLKDGEITPILESPELESYGVAAVVAPGTGLGMGFLLRRPDGDTVIPSEGGHARFAPSDQREIRLLEFLSQRDPYVSVEHLLCGPGIKNIFDFVVSESPSKLDQALQSEIAAATDPAALISQKALAQSDSLCAETLEIFLSILGSHCGNVAVTTVATIGVYLGGGIPPKISRLLSAPIFRERFLDRGKMAHLAARIPVSLINNDYAAVTGAASLAARA